LRPRRHTNPQRHQNANPRRDRSIGLSHKPST
jgi:hypothetical protein